jgi:hypothetical protein
MCTPWRDVLLIIACEGCGTRESVDSARQQDVPRWHELRTPERPSPILFCSDACLLTFAQKRVADAHQPEVHQPEATLTPGALDAITPRASVAVARGE